jgi:hypothetical protein
MLYTSNDRPMKQRTTGVMAIPHTNMTSRHDALMKEFGDPLALVDKIITLKWGRVSGGICVYTTPTGH